MARDKSVRRELSRADNAKRGLATVLVVAAILALIFAKTSGSIGGPQTITARVTNAGGSLIPGADVKMRGLIVGSVASISPDPSPGCASGASAPAHQAALTVGTPVSSINLACVDIKVNLLGGMLNHIPANVVARILPATAFGTSYLDLTTHGVAASASLPAGAVVAPDSTQGTLELQTALDDIDTLVKAINPSKLDATLTATAQALSGRGQELNSLFKGLDTLFTNLSPKLPLVRQDLAELALNLGVLQQAAPALLDGVGSALGALRAIATHRTSLATLLTQGRSLSDQANGFLSEISANLTTLLNASSILVNTYDLYRTQAFAQAFAALRKFAPRLASAVDHGFLRLEGPLLTKTPPYYTAANCPTFGTARGDNCGSLGRAAVGSTSGGAK